VPGLKGAATNTEEKMKISKLIRGMSLFVAWAMIFDSSAFAQDITMGNRLAELEKQMSKMQKTIEDQNQQIAQLKSGGPKIQVADSGKDNVAGGAPMTEYEFNNMLDSSLGGSQKWLKNLKFAGDLRLRYEAFHNSGGSSPGGGSSDWDRNRFRFRLRYGFEKTFSPEWKAGFSMASGDKVTNNGHNGDPTSTNQTMGSDFNFKNIWIEKAYGTYTPNWAKIGPVKDLEITGGKFTNPFERGSSDMVFDRDLKPEGAYEKVALNLYDSENLKVKSYFTGGQFILSEVSGNNTGGSGAANTTSSDAEMYGFQWGLNPTFYVPGLERPVDLLSAISYFDYSDYSRNRNFIIDSTAGATNLANGNSVCDANSLCTGFKVLELYHEVAITPYGLPIRPFVDYAHNFGAGQNLPYINGNSRRDLDAYGLGVKLGKSVKKGDWEAMYQYKWIGADSVPGAFNDSDFGYRGYAGNQGSVIKLGYMLTDYLTVNAAAYIVRNLNIGENLGSGSIKSEQQSRFQMDLVWKF
jgi:hypothetical protein